MAVGSDSNDSGDPLQSVEDLVHQLVDGTLPHEGGFHFRSFLSGILSVAAVLGLLALAIRYGVSRAQRRRKLAETLQRLSALDAEGARKLFGNVGLPSWLGSSDDEHVNWANAFMGQLWAAKLSKVLSKMGAEMLQPILDSTKPPWMTDIKLMKFDLGDVPPRLNTVEVFHHPRRDDNGRAQEIIMEMNFEWKGDQDIDLMVKPLPRHLGPASFVLRFLSTFIKLRVGLEDFYIAGRVRVMARPLLETLPCVSATQVAFVGMPRYSFDLQVYGGNVRMVPGVQAYLNGLVRDSLKPYILPEKLIFPIMEQGANDMVDPPRALLVVKVLEAKHLPKQDLLGLCDPYVRVSVSEHIQQKTEVIKHTLHPKWRDEEMTLVVHEPDLQQLTCLVYDWDRLTQDSPFAKATVAIKGMPQNEPQDLWLDLEDPDESQEHVRRPVPGLATGKKVAHGAVAAPRKLFGSSNKPQLHLEVTYREFGGDEIKRAMQDNQAGRAPDPNTWAGETAQLLQGGLLTVEVKQARYLLPTSIFKLGFGASMRVEVKVADQEKKTGTSNRLSPMFNEDMEFVVDGPTSSDTNTTLEVEVWDRFYINDFKGRLQIPLSHIKQEKSIAKTWELQGVGDKVPPGKPAPELEMKLRWVGFLDIQ